MFTTPVAPIAFISYSRSDLAFAQALVGKLRGRYGIPCWLDVEQLSPGSPWAGALDQALTQADLVVLVASRDSVASPHCQHEWRRARDADKRVVIAATERLDLPAELRQQPIVDMRRGRKAWPRLAETISSGECAPSPAEEKSLTRIRVPGPMLILALPLLVLVLYQAATVAQMSGFAWELLPGTNGAVVVLVVAQLLFLAAWTVFTARWTLLFLQRKKSQRGLYVMALVPLVWSLIALAFPEGTVGYFGLPITWAILLLTSWFNERGLATWVPSTPRRRPPPPSTVVDGGELSAAAAVLSSAGRFTRYTLQCVPQDEIAARRIERVIARWGFHGRRVEDGPSDVSVLLLSNATTASFRPLATMADSTPVVCVVLSGIVVDDGRSAIHRVQWVDYRSRDDQTLHALAQWLGQGTGTTALPPSMEDEPAHLSSIKLPFGINFVRWVLTLVAAIILGGLIEIPLRWTIEPSTLSATWDIPLGLISGLSAAAFAIAAAVALVARATTFTSFALLCSAGIGCLCLAVAGSGPSQDEVLGVVVAVGLVGIICGIAAAVEFGGFRSWFLARRLPWRNPVPTLAPVSIGRLARREASVAVVIALISAIILAGDAGLQ